MNNGKESQNERLEKLLSNARLPEPATELKDRITAEATKAWNQTLPELPWQTPVRRLIVSAAAAVLIIWLANSSSDYALARWRSGGPQVAHQQLLDLDTLPEIPYCPLVRGLVSASRIPSITGASALRSYTETVRHVLDEMKQNEVSKPMAPAEGSSSLFPSQSGFNSYS
jgi:hypothetical protein